MCLESVRVQTRLPDRVVVVDGSDDDATAELVDRLAAHFPCELVRVATGPGIAAARNLALRTTTAPIVHFVDDDTVLDRRYLAAVLDEFERDAGVGAVGGFVTDARFPMATPAARVLLLDSLAPGRVLASGKTSMVGWIPRPLDVEWLAGCSMSLRRDALHVDPFDERFTVPVFGEDTELTYRLAQTHRLVLTPYARIEHHMSPIGREDAVVRTRLEVRGRWMRVERGTGRLRRGSFWWSVVGQTGYLAGRGLARRSRTALLMAVATAQGALDVLDVFG